MGHGTTEHKDLGLISIVNLRRAKRWHNGGLEEWTPSDWACAMAGEAGEVCNAVKKLNRIDKGVQQSNGPKTRAEAVAAVAQEIGDTFLYLDLLAQRLGINMAEAIADTFNRVSEREGFPERIER
jgi:NTP pyrophosphatase (non-canonical NTP hydrolase)